MEKSLSAREKAVSMLHPPISVGSCAWSHARSRSAWGEASARAMPSKDLRMRLCANSRASHATLGGVMPAMYLVFAQAIRWTRLRRSCEVFVTQSVSTIVSMTSSGASSFLRCVVSSFLQASAALRVRADFANSELERTQPAGPSPNLETERTAPAAEGANCGNERTFVNSVRT